MRLEASIAIHRPPEIVWAFLGNISNLPKWDRGVARAIEVQEAPAAAQPEGTGYEFHTEAHAHSPGNAHHNGRMAYRIASVDTEAQRCVVDPPVAPGTRASSVARSGSSTSRPR
jgi:Polyketide cyclase / dehydrase and lipid transport